MGGVVPGALGRVGLGGRFLRRSFVLLALLLGCTLLHAHSGQPFRGALAQWRVVSPGVKELTLEFPEVQLVGDTQDQGSCRVGMVGADYLQVKGHPELPYFTYSLTPIQIAGIRVSLVSIEEESYSDVDLVRSAGLRLRSGHLAPPVTYTHSAALFPEEPYSLAKPYQMGSQIGQVLQIFPCRYDADQRQLHAVRRLVLRIEGVVTSSTRGVSSSSRGSTLGQGAYGGEMVIVTRSKYLKTLSRFIQWKRRQGRGVAVVLFGERDPTYPSVEDTVAMRSWLKAWYVRPESQFKYLLLVGSRREVPPLRVSKSWGREDSDQSWGELLGEDSYNEVCVGRFSCYDTLQLATQVDRTIYYERDVASGSAWLKRAVLLASNEIDKGDNGETDREHSRVIRNLLLQNGYSRVDTLYDTEKSRVSKGSLIEYFNKGFGVMGYTGHGFQKSWLTSNFSSADVKNLTNEGCYPFIFNTACKVGRMQSATSTCLAEELQWARRGKGIVGIVGITGSSDDQYWDPPMRGQDAMFEYLMGSGLVRTLGEVTTLGMARMMDKYDGLPGTSPRGSSGQQTKETWNLFGDPSMVLRRDVPSPIQAQVPGVVYSDAQEFRVPCSEVGLYAVLRVTHPDGREGYVKGEYSHGMYLFPLDGIQAGDQLALTMSGIDRETLCRDGIRVEPALSRRVKLGDISLLSNGVPLDGTVNPGASVNVNGSVVLLQELLAGDRVEVEVAPYPSNVFSVKSPVGGRKDLMPQLQGQPSGFITSQVEWAECSTSQYLAHGELVGVTVLLRLNGDIVEMRDFMLGVSSSEILIVGQQLSSKSGANATLSSGEILFVSLYLQNAGGEVSGPLEVELQWVDGSGAPLSGSAQVVQSMSSIAPGEREEVAMQIALPDPVAPALAGLRCRLVSGGEVIVEDRIPLRYGMPLQAAGLSRLNYPFGVKGRAAVFSQVFSPDQLRTLLEAKSTVKEVSVVGLVLPVQLDGQEAKSPTSVRCLLSQSSAWQPLSGLSSEELERVRESMFEVESILDNGQLFLEIPVQALDLSRPLHLALYTVGDDMRYNYACAVKDYGRPGTVEFGTLEEGAAAVEWEPWQSLPQWQFRVPEIVDLPLRIEEAESGTPVSDAEIQFQGQALQSNGNGMVSLQALEGDYTVSVDSRYHEMLTTYVRLSKFVHSVPILQLRRVGAVPFTLHILDGSNRPVANARVKVDGVLQTVRPEGFYILQIPVGKHTLTVYAQGYDSVVREVDVIKDVRHNVGRFILSTVPPTNGSESGVLTAALEGLDSDLQLFPNPCGGALYLQSSEDYAYSLHTLQGQCLIQGRGHGRAEIPMESLADGVYLVCVRFDHGGQRVLRVVKGN